ncbi:hypothetical protein BVG84_04465 [Serratia marcescens]|nr:hypothetical protein BVG84_04465 [Serratia marcescens]
MFIENVTNIPIVNFAMEDDITIFLLYFFDILAIFLIDGAKYIKNAIGSITGKECQHSKVKAKIKRPNINRIIPIPAIFIIELS